MHLGEPELFDPGIIKLIEESPSSALNRSCVKTMGEAAVRAAKAAGYTNAGTIEFLLEKRILLFYEMNTDSGRASSHRVGDGN